MIWHFKALNFIPQLSGHICTSSTSFRKLICYWTDLIALYSRHSSANSLTCDVNSLGGHLWVGEIIMVQVLFLVELQRHDESTRSGGNPAHVLLLVYFLFDNITHRIKLLSWIALESMYFWNNMNVLLQFKVSVLLENWVIFKKIWGCHNVLQETNGVIQANINIIKRHPSKYKYHKKASQQI